MGINIQVGKFLQNNKHTGLNKHTGRYKRMKKKMILSSFQVIIYSHLDKSQNLINVQAGIRAYRWENILKNNKRTCTFIPYSRVHARVIWDIIRISGGRNRSQLKRRAFQHSFLTCLFYRAYLLTQLYILSLLSKG